MDSADETNELPLFRELDSRKTKPFVDLKCNLHSRGHNLDKRNFYTTDTPCHRGKSLALIIIFASSGGHLDSQHYNHRWFGARQEPNGSKKDGRDQIKTTTPRGQGRY
jgi:hypothetical protein